MAEKIKLGIMISGGGTNMQAIVNACKNRSLDAYVAFVGADNPEAKGLAWAKAQGIPTFVVDYKKIRKSPDRKFFRDGDFVREILRKSAYVHSRFGGNEVKQLVHINWKVKAEDIILKEARKHEIDLLVLAGFMQICTAYLIDAMNRGENDLRIMNIHPALLPSFPGTDGYGNTIDHGCKVGGCTVHFVDYGEDSGPIIGQRAIPVLPEDDVDSFRERGLQEEYKLYPKCIQLFAKGWLRIIDNGGRKTVLTIPSGLEIVEAGETHNRPFYP